jgi:hypothetical protein
LLSESFLTDGRDLFIKKIESKAGEQTIVSMSGSLDSGPS